MTDSLVVITEPGYLYVFLNNEEEQPTEVYFDDLTIRVDEGPVIQVNDYYPYGMTAYTLVREGEEEVKEKFQGKEYNDKTGLHDFHARQYDAALGRWFAVDPAGQFVSPYVAMGNNPVTMIDPDGKVVWLVPVAIGAVVGAYQGAKAMQQKDGNTTAGFWGGAAIGAIGGASGYFAPAGILPGMVYGAATGAALGAGSAALYGNDIGKGALYGGIAGGVLGGISGGLSAYETGANVWTGESPISYSLPASEIELEGSTKTGYTGYNDRELNAFRKKQLGSHPGTLKTTVKFHKDITVNSDGNFVGAELLGADGNPSPALAYTRPTIWGGGRFSTIHVAPSAFENNAKLFLTLGHEYVHAYHNYYGLFNLVPYYRDYTEYGAYEWTVRAVGINKFWEFKGYEALLWEYERLTGSFGLQENFTNAPVNTLFKY